MINKKIGEKEALETKFKYNLYLEKGSNIMNTPFKVEDVFAYNIDKDNIIRDRIIKSKNFF